jgi:hypothetical protein
MERVILAITLRGSFDQTRFVALEVLPLRSKTPLEDFVRFEHRNCFSPLVVNIHALLMWVVVECRLPAQIALFERKERNL